MYNINDIVMMKKPHPCGCSEWEILRTGVDFRLRCQNCGHLIMISREKFERAVKRVVREHINDTLNE